ncbi:MAG: serine/threonine-protein kinase [Planctomycetaceae bacterium]
MARSASGPEHTDPDERLAQLLDEYLMAVQTGDHVCGQARSAEILRDHPELLSLLGCLDKLDRFAPPPGPGDDFTPSPESPRSGVERTLISTPPADGHGHSARSGGGSSLFDALPVDFGGYELLEEIGRGGMGVVYKARHKTLQATVAIKMIRSSQWASQDEIRRFYQEARAAASLTHSHIVKVHDVGERSGLHYLTMDLIEGSSLSGLSRNTPIEPDRAAELLAAVARAVDYLHEKGIVHRDLKPANILLDAHGIPYVTDFGLAKVYSESDQTATGTIVGTPCYMSPEQAWGRPSEVTKLSDIYSLGAILYELLTGRPPFREDNPLDVLLKVREADPLPPRAGTVASPATSSRSASAVWRRTRLAVMSPPPNWLKISIAFGGENHSRCRRSAWFVGCSAGSAASPVWSVG